MNNLSIERYDRWDWGRRGIRKEAKEVEGRGGGDEIRNAEDFWVALFICWTTPRGYISTFYCR